MTEKNTGGAAFPGPAFTRNGYQSGHDMGMTLRDWFAGQALANTYAQHEQDPSKVAEWAYQIADAMLAAREVDQ